MSTLKKILPALSLAFAFLSAGAQEMPSLETYSLRNGLKVYLIRFGKIEAMHLSVVINSGRKNEIPGQQGYNGLVANLALKGNQIHSEEDQNDKAFALGCELKSQANNDRTTFSCNFLTKNAPEVFDLMSAAILKPKFEKEKIDQFISYLISYNTPAKMDIDALANVYSRFSVYGLDNPLGRSIYKQQLKLVTPEKIKTFHEFNYTPKNTRLVVCGNFDPGQVKKLVEDYFGSWQSTYGEVNGVALEMPSIKKKETSFVNRSGATQCALRWTKPAPARNDKDALAFTIANAMFNQVLFREIREKGGKTYSIGSAHDASQFSNLMTISCSVRSEEMKSTLDLFDTTLEEFYKGNFTKDEFDIEITRFKTDLFTNEYPEEIANFYNPILYDFKARTAILSDLAKITPDDVKKVIKKYYVPGIYKLVVAGDETRVSQQLAQMKDVKKLTPADIEYK